MLALGTLGLLQAVMCLGFGQYSSGPPPLFVEICCAGEPLAQVLVLCEYLLVGCTAPNSGCAQQRTLVPILESRKRIT